MNEEVIKSAIRCSYCGTEIESVSGNDFRSHTCQELQRVRGTTGQIAVDGGRGLFGRRILGHPLDWVDVSIYSPARDPLEVAAAREARIREFERNDIEHDH